VEGVDGGGGLEVEVARPVDALEQVTEEAGDVVDVEGGVVLAGDDEQVLGQGELPLAEDGVGAGEQLLGKAGGGVGDVALAADGEQEGVDPGSVDGVDGVEAGDDGGDDGAGQLVDDLAEAGVLLGGPADDGKGPDGARAVVDVLDLEDGEVVGEAVVAEV